MVEEDNSTNPINVVRLAELSRNLQGVQLLIEKISFDLEELRTEIGEIKIQNQRNEKLLEKVQAFSSEFNLLQQQTRKDNLIQGEMKKAWDEFTVFKNQISSDIQRVFQIIYEISDENERQYKLFTDRYNYSIEENTSIKLISSSMAEKVEEITTKLEIFNNQLSKDQEFIELSEKRLEFLEKEQEVISDNQKLIEVTQYRIGEINTQLKSAQSAEKNIIELLTNQKSMQSMHEKRMIAFEKTLDIFQTMIQVVEDEQRRLGRGQIVNSAVLEKFDERLDVLRNSMLDVLNNQIIADSVNGRKRFEENERELRLAKELVTKLAEQTEETIQETPI
ncbi:MAG: hypothetical protein MKZ81_05235 [Dehalococcoidia bacterium]|nr:hypothetical protein [Dehalococcoidia bacterium]